MAGAIGDLVIRLGLDMAQMRGDVGKATAQMDRFFTTVDTRASQMQRSLSSAATAFKAFFAAAVVQQAVQGFDALLGSIAEIGDQADALGITTQAMQAFTYAAKLSGISQEQLAKQLKDVGNSFVEAVNGSKTASAAYATLGINVEKLNKEGVTTQQIFTEVLSKLAQMPPGIERTNAATAIFGKQATEVLKAIGDGFLENARAFEESGKGFSESVIALADDAQKSFIALGETMKGSLNGPLQEILPNVIALNKTFSDFFSSLNKSSPVVAQMFGLWSQALDAMAEGAVLGFGLLTDSLELLIGLLKGAWEYLKLGAEAVFTFYRVTDRLVHLDWDGATAALQAFGDEAVNTTRRVGKEIRDNFNLDKTEELTAKFRLARLEARNLAAAPVAKPPALTITPAESDDNKKAIDKALREKEAAEERLLAIEERNKREGAEIQRKASQAKLDEMLKGYEAEREAQERENEIERQALVDHNQKIHDEQVAFAQSIQDIFTGNVADALTDVVTGAKSVGDAFTDMAKSIVQSLTRIAAQKVAEQIFGGVGAGGQSGVGGFIASLFAGARASGGPVSAGKIYKVGERGPEYIMPRQAGMVVPGSQVSNSTNNLAVNVNVPPATDRRSAQQIASSVGVAVQRAMRRNQ